ncbi:MAG: hypothetical protein LBP93_07995 [Treponema sp.]|jgi:hypothetical protein|nr:hypothetical protein [Treponema sp.]
MKGFYDPIIVEVRRNREKLLEIYGGVEDLHKHMDDERPRFEKEGWYFVSDEEIAALQRRHEPLP